MHPKWGVPDSAAPWLPRERPTAAPRLSSGPRARGLPPPTHHTVLAGSLPTLTPQTYSSDKPAGAQRQGRTSNPPMINRALILCFRICVAMSSNDFPGSVLERVQARCEARQTPPAPGIPTAPAPSPGPSPAAPTSSPGWTAELGKKSRECI